MKIYQILTESQVGKQALDYKRSNRYPDGTDIPESLPPRYQPASFPGVPKNQRCDNCGYYDTKTKKCDKFKGEPVVKPAYWCLKWEPMEEEVTEGVAGPKQCWPGHRKVGTQPGTGKNKGKRVNDCKKIGEDTVEEAEKKGLYYYVNKRKKAGTSRDASSPKAPTAQAWKDAAKTAKKEDVSEGERTMSRAAKGNEKYGKDGMKALAKAGRDGASDEKLDKIRDKHNKYDESVEEGWSEKYKKSINCSNPKGFSQKAHCASKNEDIEEGYGKYYCSTDKKWKTRQGPKQTRSESVEVSEGIDELARVLELSGLNLTPDQQFDIIEEMVESLALEHGVDAEQIWEDFESVDDEELLESAAWRNKSGKNKNGGLNAKGVASYRRENPGSKLQTAVTTKPSKLKKGSKAAKRRKSFCARMSGVKGPMKKPNGKPTRKALALRKWNC